MTLRQLLISSLRFHFRTHLGVLLGAAVATAVLVGALAVGDSVRISLREKALERLAGFRIALQSHDRFFGSRLAERVMNEGGKEGDFFGVLESRLALSGNIARQDGASRANRVFVYGATPWSLSQDDANSLDSKALEEGVWLSAALAGQLNAKLGDELILRLHKPSALSRDAIVTPRNDASVALKLRFKGVIGPKFGGNFSLQSGQSAPLNAFVHGPRLAAATGLEGRANQLLGIPNVFVHRDSRKPDPVGGLAMGVEALRTHWNLDDAELSVRSTNHSGFSSVELSSRRIFLDPSVLAIATNLVVSGARPMPILTYLVNTLSAGDSMAPYSMVTAAGPPWTPADLADDEILVNEWLAEDLKVRVGDTVRMTYYRADSASSLVDQTNRFRIRAVVPMTGLHADRSLMPEFPGLSKAESTHDWDAGFDLVHKVRDTDETYWKQWRGTPKAFVNLRVGQAMWGNRFGKATAVRWHWERLPDGAANPGQLGQTLGKQILSSLKPEDVGLKFEDVYTPALSGASGGQDFGGLFIGFSFFLIVSALLLTSMLFRFGLEQRAAELGTLLAVGWPLRRVMLTYLMEGTLVSGIGAILGAFGGVGYGSAVIWGLTTLWKDAIGGAGLDFHPTVSAIVGGMVGSIVVASLTLWLTLRSAASRPARELLNEGVSARAWKVDAKGHPRTFPIAFSLLALGLVGAGWFVPESQKPGLFFGAGALSLIAGILWIRLWLRRAIGSSRTVALDSVTLARRAPSRNPSRSLSTIAMLASAVFLIVAVGANRLDAEKDAGRRGSGTGGFAFWGETALPVVMDLNSQKGQEQYGLDPKRLSAAGVGIVGMRVRDGDEASCLNLNLSVRPRILGVDPSELSRRGTFTFAGFAKGFSSSNGWELLRRGPASVLQGSEGLIPEIPAIGDASSIQYAMKKSLGDTLDYVDEAGRPFRLKLVASVANSILQGNVLIDEAEFTRRFPTESGRRAFLVDVRGSDPGTPQQIAAELSRALQDAGMELVPASVRLNRFNAVQNTYLNTFQVLGGLGLLLGSIGLGVVVLRNVYDRRGEFAVLQAVGFTEDVLRRLVLAEHQVLLFLGMGMGLAASVIVLIPVLATPRGGDLPYGSLVGTLLLVVGNGLVWTAWATRRALGRGVLNALRGE